MKLTDADAIREVLATHRFTSTSTSRAGFSTHHAGCTCNPSIEFDWYERDAEYQWHLLAATFAAGRAVSGVAS